MPFIAVYSFDLFTIPGLTATELATSTHGNDPGQTGSNPYNPDHATWTGQDFTFDGGSPTIIDIADDDAFFEDGYVETGGLQTLASPVSIGGQSFGIGTDVQNEFSLLGGGLELFVVRIGGDNVGFAVAGTEPLVAGTTYVFDDTRDGAADDSLDGASPSQEPYDNVLCFGSGTEIATPDGPVPVEALSVGDHVMTLDSGPRPILWVGSTRHRWTNGPDKGKPIRIEAGALGADLPLRCLTLSPQHRVLIPTEDGGRLGPAKGMTGLSGIRQAMGCRQATYVHLMLDAHHVVIAEGAPCETLYAGERVMHNRTPLQRAAIALVARRWERADGIFPPARPFLTVRQTRELLAERGRVWDAGDVPHRVSHGRRRLAAPPAGVVVGPVAEGLVAGEAAAAQDVLAGGPALTGDLGPVMVEPRPLDPEGTVLLDGDLGPLGEGVTLALDLEGAGRAGAAGGSDGLRVPLVGRDPGPAARIEDRREHGDAARGMAADARIVEHRHRRSLVRPKLVAAGGIAAALVAPVLFAVRAVAERLVGRLSAPAE